MFISCYSYISQYTKAQFERRTFHVPKIIEIGRPKWYKFDVFFFSRGT